MTSYAIEPDKHGRTTLRQKCNYCEEDFVDLVNCLKGHLLKCEKLPKNIKGPLKIQDQDSGSMSGNHFIKFENPAGLMMMMVVISAEGSSNNSFSKT
ncbi:zinc finger bed domain-containing protein 1-like [Gigaspora margarita]|uniref:Zinc finger bed domain-containing protein 1-like n=1 Tax=Gigaspora margarita TaxID=4874 RepID=A0A8H4AUM9_GIGMA|nr:zinc finger bed domain-containing protein 1-like [Gigaspora margarita]